MLIRRHSTKKLSAMFPREMPACAERVKFSTPKRGPRAKAALRMTILIDSSAFRLHGQIRRQIQDRREILHRKQGFRFRMTSLIDSSILGRGET